MPFTYQEILEEVLPVYHQNPERFMRFYHAVNNILAAMYIIEETTRKDVLDDFLEFPDDYSAIRHVPKVVPAVNWHHFYSNRR